MFCFIGSSFSPFFLYCFLPVSISFLSKSILTFFPPSFHLLPLPFPSISFPSYLSLSQSSHQSSGCFLPFNPFFLRFRFFLPSSFHDPIYHLNPFCTCTFLPFSSLSFFLKCSTAVLTFIHFFISFSNLFLFSFSMYTLDSSSCSASRSRKLQPKLNIVIS